MHEVSLPPLEVGDFPAFFSALWTEAGGDVTTPFPWQLELLRQVHDEQRWPELLDLPTGSGKTSVLEIAVFLQALGAALAPADRWMPRRVALVVDRRVVVDQADQRGEAIRRKLVEALVPVGETAGAAPADGVMRSVAERLCHLSGDGPPLVTTVLRGGIVRDETWVQRPDVPAIISSTVDQVGSRLLFRGYGVSPGMRPIHAGLLANDTLFLLDEVHLARPFAQTLGAIGRYRTVRDDRAVMAPDRWQVVQMTATPVIAVERRFPTVPIEPGSHPVLKRRLTASKPARLEVVKVPRDSATANERFAMACVAKADMLLAADHVRTVGVIVNRVDTARRVARLIAERDGGAKVCLLTGRMRGIDRERVLAEWDDRLRIGHSRDETDEPLVVVATQSIEAGADFDLDGMVTECASLDALRQRFGRVDRDGRLAQDGTPSSSVVAIRSTDVDAKEPDPVYGRALAATWAWLQQLESVDFGLDRLVLPDVEVLRALTPEPDAAPRLFPTHLDRWVQTSQRPSVSDPDVARWLHGMAADEQQADVEVVWRADLDESLFRSESLDAHQGLEQAVIDRVAACPPTSSEALGVPIAAFRRWARGDRSDLATSDAPSSGHVDEPSRQAGDGRRYLRWLGTTGEMTTLDRVRPGDTIVLAASNGGLRLGNWDPSATDSVADAVVDVATVAIARQRRQAVLRLTDDLVEGWIAGTGAPDDVIDASTAAGPVTIPKPDELDLRPFAERVGAVRDLIHAVLERPTVGAPIDVLGHLSSGSSIVVRSFPDAVRDGRVHLSYVVWSRRRMEGRATGSLAPEDGRDATSFTGAREVTLAAHLGGVEAWATKLAANLGFPPELVADLGLAGRLHDVGKIDPRFQVMLHDGDEVRAALARAAGRPLAKSASADTDRAGRQRARQASGYPERARHELLSRAMIDHTDALRAATAPDLVRHLVVSHHGFGRYRFDAVKDRDPVDGGVEPTEVVLDLRGATLQAVADYGLARLDRGVPEAFWVLVRRYGWFGLSWLEAILRLADHARSRAEQDGSAFEDKPGEGTEDGA